MKFPYLACVLVLSGLVSAGYGCKSDDGGGGDGSFLSIIETLPEDGALEVPVESRVGFQIDGPVDPSTLTADTFFVTDEDGVKVPGTPVVPDGNPNSAELLFDESLSVITNYTVTVTTGLRSQNGLALEEEFEWDFKTLDSAWGVSAWIEEDVNGTSAEQEIVVDGQLNALAVWEHTTATGTAIWANRYTRTDLWGEPGAIDDGNGGAASPAVAADDAGNGVAVWERSDDGGFTANIWTNRYDVEQQAWGTAELLQNREVTRARLPLVAADSPGNAMAIWVQADVDTGQDVVWARHYDEGTSAWGAAGLISEAPGSVVGATGLGIDGNGNAIAAWSRGTLMGDVVWANRYTDGTGWGTPEPIKSDGNTSARGMRISVGRGGDAFVIWTQGDETRDDIGAVRFSGSTWGDPERIDDYDRGNKGSPDVAVDGAGVAHAVWWQADADDDDATEDFDNIWANQYTPTGWGAPQLIEPPNEDPTEDGGASSPRVSVNSAGNAFVVWLQIWNDWGSVWSNRLDPGTGWMTAELIEDIGRPARAPKIAVDEDRHAHALWLHWVDTSFDWVRTNRFE